MNDVEKAVLERMRRELEATDRELLALVARRADQVRDLWAWKREQGRALYDPARENFMRRQWLDNGREADLEPDAVLRLFHAVLDATAPLSAMGDLTRPRQSGVLLPGHVPERVPEAGNDSALKRPSVRRAMSRPAPTTPHNGK